MSQISQLSDIELIQLLKESENAAFTEIYNRYGEIKGHQVGTVEKPDSLFNQHYTNLFPTAYLTYKLDSAGNNQLNFSYGIRIGRPYYQALNPFIRLVDKFTYFSGNPLLKPQYSYNYDLKLILISELIISSGYLIHGVQN
jgi:hypothetical protein